MVQSTLWSEQIREEEAFLFCGGRKRSSKAGCCLGLVYRSGTVCGVLMATSSLACLAGLVVRITRACKGVGGVARVPWWLSLTNHSWIVHRWESLVLVLMYLIYIVIMK